MPPQQIFANSKGGLIIEGGVMLSEYGTIIDQASCATLPWTFNFF